MEKSDGARVLRDAGKLGDLHNFFKFNFIVVFPGLTLRTLENNKLDLHRTITLDELKVLRAKEILG